MHKKESDLKISKLESKQYGAEAKGVNEFASGGATAFDNEDEVFPEYAAEKNANTQVFTSGGATAFDNEDEVFPEYAAEKNANKQVFTSGGATAFDNENEVFPEYAAEKATVSASRKLLL